MEVLFDFVRLGIRDDEEPGVLELLRLEVWAERGDVHSALPLEGPCPERGFRIEAHAPLEAPVEGVPCDRSFVDGLVESRPHVKVRSCAHGEQNELRGLHEGALWQVHIEADERNLLGTPAVDAHRLLGAEVAARLFLLDVGVGGRVHDDGFCLAIPRGGAGQEWSARVSVRGSAGQEWSAQGSAGQEWSAQGSAVQQWDSESSEGAESSGRVSAVPVQDSDLESPD